ncbi:MAG TPA: CDP-alcohol phosphatidyltransferase family protein [Candidatus Eisenbacteria bacterium]|jgi:cardiolipin synthase|nr:CDP-alcohol phosphatidyltransferase family protein [Candidatus Eisenbacteria bacterium]
MTSRILTVPNQLTFLRLGFLPFFIISIHYRRYDIALAVLIIAALTDGLDGLLARSLNQKTALGAYLDPIADKLLLSSSFVVLALNRKISWWLAILVLSRDVLLLTSAAVILVVAGYRLFQPSIYGKLTTALQIMLVFAVVLLAVADWPWLQFVRVILGYLVAGFTVFSGFHYSIVVARRLGEQQHRARDSA